MREPARRQRLGQVVDAFGSDCRARGLSPRTISCYLEGIASYRASLETEPERPVLTDLNLEADRVYAVGLGDGRPPATVANRVRAIKVFSHWCVEESYHAVDPPARLRRPTVPRTIVAAFSDDQVRTMLAAAPPPLAITLCRAGSRHAASDAITPLRVNGCSVAIPWRLGLPRDMEASNDRLP